MAFEFEYKQSRLSCKEMRTVKTFANFTVFFYELGLYIGQGELSDWLSSDLQDTRCETLTDEEICVLVSKSEIEGEDDCQNEEEEMVCSVSHSQAGSMFDKCLTWLEHQQEASAHNTSVLGKMCTLASEKRVTSLEQSRKTDFFSNAAITVLYCLCAHGNCTIP